MLLTDISYFHKHQKGRAREDDLSASLWLFPAQPETSLNLNNRKSFKVCSTLNNPNFLLLDAKHIHLVL